MNKFKPIKESHQNFWTLASIQCGSMGLLGMILGWNFAQNYGTNIAISSIFIGNLIVWLIGIVVISLSRENRENSIETIKKILGKSPSFFAAFCLILAFLSWSIFQLKTSTIAIDNVFKIVNPEQNNVTIRSGAALGFFAALLSMGGIRIIKWINIVALPILIIFHLLSFITSNHQITLHYDWNISFSIISLIVLFFLPGTINLPTFFRHSRSLADSYLALTLMTIFFTFFQITSIWMNFQGSLTPDFGISENTGYFLQLTSACFIILITTANMLVNIYFASASWEAFVPKSEFKGPKEYAILGLIGTAAYTFIQISPPMQLLINLANFFLANLGFILLITFLFEIIIKRKPKIFGRLVGSSSWFISCIIATILEIRNSNNETHILLISMGISAFIYLIFIFIEETIWSIKELLKKI